MAVAKPMKKCPFCKEPIAASATRCNHCQADLVDGAGSKGQSWFSQFNTFRVGFVSGLLFSLLIAILTYGHLAWGG